jgi:hypothetical protein
MSWSPLVRTRSKSSLRDFGSTSRNRKAHLRRPLCSPQMRFSSPRLSVGPTWDVPPALVMDDFPGAVEAQAELAEVASGPAKKRASAAPAAQAGYEAEESAGAAELASAAPGAAVLALSAQVVLAEPASVAQVQASAVVEARAATGVVVSPASPGPA